MSNRLDFGGAYVNNFIGHNTRPACGWAKERNKIIKSCRISYGEKGERMVIIAIMYNESGGALIRTQSAEPERALNEVAEWFARDLIEQVTA